MDVVNCYACFSRQQLRHLPLEMLETVLMRAFLMVYSSDHDGDDDRRPYKPGKSKSSESRAFTLLSSVCLYWRRTLSGWPESPTRHWLRHRLQMLIERECTMHRLRSKTPFIKHA